MIGGTKCRWRHQAQAGTLARCEASKQWRPGGPGERKVPPVINNYPSRNAKRGRLKRSASYFICAKLRSGGSLPLRGLRSLRSLRPLPSSSSSSLRDNSLPTGPSPCPCPGVDTPLRGNCRPLCSALAPSERCISLDCAQVQPIRTPH